MEHLKQQIAATEERLAEQRRELETMEIKEKHKRRLIQGMGPELQRVPDDELGKLCKEMKMMDFLRDISGVYSVKTELPVNTACLKVGELAWLLRPQALEPIPETAEQGFNATAA